MSNRSILHININSFFAAVERKRRPETGGRAVIVGAPRGNTSGVVVSASREAARLGVEEGMSLRQAQRACPEAIVLAADYALYRQVFEEFLNILAQYSPLLEPDSLGSAYLDVTASRSLFGDACAIGMRIREQVSVRLGLPLSIGCASSKLVARIASIVRSAGLSRPPVVKVAHGSEAGFISPLPVTVLDAVNSKIAKRLRELGVTTVGQLAMIPERLLVRQFGQAGSAMRRQSLGVDASQVRAAYPPEIIKTERMFDSPPEEPAEVEAHIREMIGEALAKLGNRGSLAGEVMLKLFASVSRRPQPPDSQTLVASVPSPKGEGPEPLSARAGHAPTSEATCVPSFFRFKKPTDSPGSVAQALGKLLESSMKPGMQIARIQIVFSDLTPGQSSQLCLLGDGERRHRLGRAMELIRERFGEGAVCFASTLEPAGRVGVLRRIAA